MFVGVDQRYMTCIKSEKQREKIRERPNHRQNGEGEKKKRKKREKVQIRKCSGSLMTDRNKKLHRPRHFPSKSSY